MPTERRDPALSALPFWLDHGQGEVAAVAFSLASSFASVSNVSWPAVDEHSYSSCQVVSWVLMRTMEGSSSSWPPAVSVGYFSLCEEHSMHSFLLGSM